MHADLALMVMGPRGTVAFQRSLGLPLPELGARYRIVAHGLGGALLVLAATLAQVFLGPGGGAPSATGLALAPDEDPVQGEHLLDHVHVLLARPHAEVDVFV